MDLEQERLARSSLDFVRKEIHFENTIIIARLTGCTIFQSILIGASIAMTKKQTEFCTDFLSVIEIISSTLFLISILCANITMSQWLKKSIN